MNRLAHALHTEIKYLIASKKNYEGLYSRLSQELSAEDLAFFAQVQTSSNASIWSATGEYVSYSQCSDAEKDSASDMIAEREISIRAQLATIPELSGLVDALLTVPGEGSVMVRKSEGEIVAVTLVQWGCRSNHRHHGIGVLSHIINRPKKDQTDVTVNLIWSDGTIEETPFAFHYKKIKKSFTTDTQGSKFIGQLKNGSTFTIAPTSSPVATQQIIVEEGKTQYEVVLPYYVDAHVAVINQESKAVADYAVLSSGSTVDSVFISDQAGAFTINHILLNETPLRLSSQQDNTITDTFQLTRGDNDLTFQIVERIAYDPLITVIDTKSEAVADYPIAIETNGSSTQYISAANGQVQISDIEADQTITVTDGYNSHNHENFTVTKEEHKFEFEVTGDVTIRLLAHDKTPIPNADLEIKIQGNTIEKSTNAQGEVAIPYKLFADGEKVAVIGQFKRDNKQIKLRKKQFVFSSDTLLYILKLKKFNKWWLLLLLLPLLLLLLIRLEKDIIVQTNTINRNHANAMTVQTFTTVSSTQPVGNVDVVLSYNRGYLYDKGDLFATRPYKKLQKTNSLGIARFQNLEYTVYSYIFKHFSAAEIIAQAHCYTSDTLRPTFHRLSDGDTVRFDLSTVLYDLDFKVVDKEDQEPLPKVWVVLEHEFLGNQYLDSARTNANGRVVFKNLPKCSNVKTVRSERVGYHPDHIDNTKIEDLLGNIDKRRKLDLRPIKKKIEFYVVSCKTNRPLPDALATITISKFNKSTTKKAYSNTRGLGKGVYDETHILSRLDIKVHKTYYQDSSFRSYLVGDFVKFPKKDRTICLEPLKNPIEFQNVDSLTGIPLVGVTNIVTIVSGNSISRTDTLLSNNTGFFTVAGVTVSDRLSIVASLDPTYNINRDKIDNTQAITLLEGSANTRIIPLAPKLLKVTFRTIDNYDKSLLANVRLTVSADGRILSPTNSGNGEFTVAAFYQSHLSIIAEKSGYSLNDSSVKDVLIHDLFRASQEQRDIPLILYPIGNSSCSNMGNSYIHTMNHAIKKEDTNTIFLTYSTTVISHPTITIQCGDTILFESSDRRITKEPLEINSCDSIQVKIKEYGGDGKWEYVIEYR